MPDTPAPAEPELTEADLLDQELRGVRRTLRSHDLVGHADVVSRAITQRDHLRARVAELERQSSLDDQRANHEYQAVRCENDRLMTRNAELEQRKPAAIVCCRQSHFHAFESKEESLVFSHNKDAISHMWVADWTWHPKSEPREERP